MRVRVLLFAILRDAAGTAEVMLDLPRGASAHAAGAALLELHPVLRPYLPRIAYAINQTYAQGETELRDGDELALIPPVSGGRA